MIKLIRATTKEQWSNTLYWFLYSSIGGLVPLWVGAIILTFLSSWPGWSYFIKNGEFALYSAALLAPSLHILIKDSKKPGFRIMIAMCLILLTVSAVLYTTVFIGTSDQITVSISERKMVIDGELLKLWTGIIFVLSCIISFLAVLLENVKSQPNIEGIKTIEMNELKKSFNNLTDKEDSK